MINIRELTGLCDKTGSILRTDCSLKDYTTFRIGGKCAALIDISSREALKDILEYICSNGLKYEIIGRGSNILASDEGYDGIILHFGSEFSEIRTEGSRITALSGALLSAVCQAAQQNGLTGMENLYGIPGTVGGGLYMNAGAYGSEMKDVVVSAEYIDESGNIKTADVSEMDLSYRHSIFSERKCIIISVTFELSEGNSEEIKSAMTECMNKRKAKQPLEYPSAGSTFKRPEGSYASLLIEQCGLKGLTVGGAQVSTKHSGFVINTGSATCSDVLELCKSVKNTVREKTGYILELEPIIL